MQTLIGEAGFQHNIRKSRFAARAAPVASIDAAAAFIARVAVGDATHNCWAYRIGPHYRFSDDGEPAGTAGRPILQAIDGQDMDRVAVVVARWFGGIKLGAGGLARAYGGTAANCLREAARVALVETVQVEIGCDFAELALIQSRLAGFEASAGVAQFDAAGARLTLTLPRNRLDEVRDFLRDATRGRGTLRELIDIEPE